MKKTIIFGGAGYIGSKLATYFIENNRFDKIIIADIEPLKDEFLESSDKIEYHICDVRNDIPTQIGEGVEWIFNFAAIHREPGHEHWEYFDTKPERST